MREADDQRFINSALFIGYAVDVHKILNDSENLDTDDAQLFFTKVFLDEKKRKQFNIKLDHQSRLFQNLNGTDSKEIQLVLSGMFRLIYVGCALLKCYHIKLF
mgnify:CR=1 FL=1